MLELELFLFNRSSSNPASPLVKETSMEEGGPNTISRTPHPTTGELYTEVQPNKTKKSDQTDSAIVYQVIDGVYEPHCKSIYTVH